MAIDGTGPRYSFSTKQSLISSLAGGFKYVLFSSLFGEDFQFDYIIFLDGLKPPTSSVWLGKTLPSKDQWGCVVGDLHPESTYLNRYCFQIRRLNKQLYKQLNLYFFIAKLGCAQQMRKWIAIFPILNDEQRVATRWGWFARTRKSWNVSEFAHQDELMKGGEYHPLFGMLSIVESFSSQGCWLLGW